MSGEGSFVGRDTSLDDIDLKIYNSVMEFLLENSLDDAMGIIMDLYGPGCGLKVDDFTTIRPLENWIDFLISKADEETDAKRLHTMNSITSALLDHAAQLSRAQQPEAAPRAAAPEQGEGAARRAAPMTLERLTAPIFTVGAAVNRGQDIFDVLLKELSPDLQDVVMDQINRSYTTEKMRRAVRNMFPPSVNKDPGPAKRKRPEDDPGNP